MCAMIARTSSRRIATVASSRGLGLALPTSTRTHVASRISTVRCSQSFSSISLQSCRTRPICMGRCLDGQKSFHSHSVPSALSQLAVHRRGISTEIEQPPELQPGPIPKPNPMNPRFALTARPFFPLYIDNLRGVARKKRRKKKGAGMSGRRYKAKGLGGTRPHSRTWEGGTAPLFLRIPRWPAAKVRNKIPKLEPLNLSKLRYFIEKGRLDTRFPITQRHLYDSRCVTKIKNGVTLYNVNDFPFPYKIDIEVAGADQSSIDAMRRVGGTVTIVYMEKVTLRAHVKPWKYEVLPRTARPTLKLVHYLEKMKARGALVRYIKPLWLIEEERRLQTQLQELDGEDGGDIAEKMARANAF